MCPLLLSALTKISQAQELSLKTEDSYLLDLIYATTAGILLDQGKDDEARVFYVGATRAKKELHLVHRTEGQYEYEPIFFHERNCA